MPVAIFTDNELPIARRPRGGGWFGWGLIAVAIVSITTIALVPSPYVIEKPGPVFDVLGTAQNSDDEEVPLIEIPVEETYPTEGSLNMLTVSITGNRESPVNWLDVAFAFLNRSSAVVPIDSVYPEGVTVEQSNEQNAVQMTDSQQVAIAAALINLGYDLETTVTIGQIGEGAPADGVLEAGDVVTSVNSEPVTDDASLRDVIQDNGIEEPVTLGIIRDGKPLTLEVTPVMSEAEQPTPIIGVVLSNAYEFPFDVTIQLENVGGPSAGQMFALGIIDKLTPGALTGGEDVAGTGTITADGEIGAIGGIRQKMYGALDAGATYFLAPQSNCDAVVGNIPDGLTVFAVSTLDDSIEVLNTISEGGNQSELPTCDAN